jgi:large subunit ribosomal protein L25
MAEQILRAEPRTVVGKKVKALRREGRIPGVVYGPVVDGTIQVSVDRREFERYYRAIGLNTLFRLELEGEKHSVMIREVQVEPVRWVPLHVDFFAPNLKQEIVTTVNVTHGEASQDLVGMVNQVITEVQVRGLPADIPMHIVADISGLRGSGEHVTAGDLPLPKGITLITSPEDTVITILAPRVTEEEEVVAASEEEAAPSETIEAAETDE